MSSYVAGSVHSLLQRAYTGLYTTAQDAFWDLRAPTYEVSEVLGLWWTRSDV